MASGPIGGGFAQTRQPLRRLLIDPETGGLLGILLGMFGIAGYMAGHKVAYTNEEKNVKLTKEAPFPWHDKSSSDDGDDDKNYKYRFHKLDSGRQILQAPNAINTTKVRVSMPKEMAEKISPKFFEEN
ncbi:19048_t:CDS:1 [Entrophospora sp. SA101]|nr:4804_t:CDS:1 [Entrophospora sp. SA101]CAJ0629362.1 6438_t:CDS:1 [Entrophospora sp. SA101]CAJ0639320.1 5165_t:CDS:1 [Entrophospora sp. SA101]CAJ0645874.1 8338_t:CDS:1 [Entrophospora sp. SA101]CAJ0752360.1 13646_t:CDS:1 [Entrophospora sp. SA101]